MGKNTRYDTLRNRIRRQFSRSKTFEVTVPTGEAETVFDIDDFERVGNDSFLASGPFNHIQVKAVSGEATVYARKNREASTAVSAGDNVNVNEQTGQRYIGYLRVEETSGAASVTVEIQAGNAVDSVEFDLLKMSGLLNVQE